MTDLIDNTNEGLEFISKINSEIELMPPIIEISTKINMLSARRLLNKYNNYFIVIYKTDNSRVYFGSKSKHVSENMLIIYKNKYRCFEYPKELNEAIKEIKKII